MSRRTACISTPRRASPHGDCLRTTISARSSSATIRASCGSSSSPSRFHAGIAGGLFAITDKIVTFDAVAAPLAANALLMASGRTPMFGPVLGAILITLMRRRQPDVELLADLCLRAVHCDGHLRAGRPEPHRPGTRADRAGRPAAPAGGALSAHPRPGADRAVRLSSGWWNWRRSSTIGMAQGRHLALFSRTIEIYDATPWYGWPACWAAASGSRARRGNSSASGTA